MSLDQLESTEEICNLYERRGPRIPETKEFENLGIENGALFHEKLQGAGKKLSEEALNLMKDEERIVPFGAEVIDSSVPLVLFAFLNSKYDDYNSRYTHRVDFELIKPTEESYGQITDPKYLLENCSSWTENLYKKKPLGERVSEMAFSDFGNNTWYQHHRKTNPKFSRQVDSTGVRVPIGKEMLMASEEIPGIQAQKEKITKISKIEPAQIGVMRWAVQNGYIPATSEDAILWERVQAGDSAFYVQDYIDEEHKQKNPDYVYWKNPKEGSDRWKEGDTWVPQVRIKFEKKFSSMGERNGGDEFYKTLTEVGEALKNVAGI